MAKLVCLCLLLFVLVPSFSFGEVVERDITFSSGDVTLGATVLIPSSSEPLPAIVIVSGAGSVGRNDYRRYAENLVQAGIITFIYDKRPGFTESASSFDILADDALAALDALKQQPGVDPNRVGLWGHSQGSWVISLAAAKSDEPDFIISVSGSGFPADQTQLWSNRTLLSQRGIKPKLIELLGINLSRMLISAGMYGDTTTDPADVLPKITKPVLALFAEFDRVNPTTGSMQVFHESLAGKNQHYQIKLLEGVNHDLGMSPDGYDKNQEITPEHAQVITQWLEQLPEPGIQVDPIPTSTIPVEPSRPLAWYESIPLHLTLVSVVLLSTILVAILHWRGLKNRPGLLITSLNTLIVLGGFIYLGWILFSGAWETGPIIASRPLVWLLLQVVTLATLIFALVSVIKWLKLKSPTPRGLPLFLTLLNTISFTYLAWYWGLFTL